MLLELLGNRLFPFVSSGRGGRRCRSSRQARGCSTEYVPSWDRNYTGIYRPEGGRCRQLRFPCPSLLSSRRVLSLLLLRSMFVARWPQQGLARWLDDAA